MFDPINSKPNPNHIVPPDQETASPLELWRQIFREPPEWRIKKFGKDILFWVIITTLLLSMGQVLYLQQALGQPFGGFLAYYDVVRQHWYIHPETPPWWPGLVNRLRHHDQLDWPDIPTNQDAVTRYATAAASGVSTISERVVRQGETQDVPVPVLKFQWSHLIDLRSGDLLTAAGFWLLAVAIYITRPQERVNRALTLLFCLAALNVWVAPPPLYLHQDIDLWVSLFNMAVVLPLDGAVLIHATLLFPTRSRFHHNRALLYGIYVTAMTLGLLLGIAWWLFWQSELPASYQSTLVNLIRLAFRGITWLLVAGLGALVARIGWVLYSDHFDRRVKRQARIVLLGLGVASLYFIPVLYRMVVGPAGEQSNWSRQPWVYVAFSIIPALLTIQILRQKRWGKQRSVVVALLWVATLLFIYLGQVDSGFLLRMDLSYTFLAVPVAVTVIALRYQTWGQTNEAWLASGICWLAVMIGVSGMAAGILHAWLRGTDILSPNLTVSPFVPAFVLILAISILWSSQVRWSGYFGALLHWQSRNYKAADRFAQRIAHQTNFNYLPHLVAQALVEELGLESAGLWLWDETRQQFWLQGEAGQWAAAVPAVLPVNDATTLSQVSLYRLDNPNIPLADWLKPLYGLVEIAIPLSTPDRLSGLLALGKRWDEDTFDQRDLDIVSLIAQQTTLFLLYAEQLATLRRLPGIVDAIQEQERAKIAQELHDTVQQFLGRLPFTLETIRELLLRKPFRAAQLYRQLLTNIESTARTLREIRSSLTAADVHSGLIAPIQYLANQVQQRTGISLKVTIDTGVDQALPLPARHALYRVVQQALDNVESHANARLVEVELHYLTDRVYFCVRDDGRGSSAEQRQQANYAGHVGLISMEARVQNLGGRFSFVSSPNAGTEASGWIPITFS